MSLINNSTENYSININKKDPHHVSKRTQSDTIAPTVTTQNTQYRFVFCDFSFVLYGYTLNYFLWSNNTLRSGWQEHEVFKISSSLVIILGIGEYDGMSNLIGVTKDYKNIIHTFYKQFGYSVAFYDSNNTFHYCNKTPNDDVDIMIKQTKLQTKDFKIKWNCDEINQYISKIHQILVQNDQGACNW